MLGFHAAGKDGIEVAMDAKTIPSVVSWIDAVQPDPREIAFLERTLGTEVPTLETLSEIETSSSLRSEMSNDSTMRHSFTFTPSTSLFVTCRSEQEIDPHYTHRFSKLLSIGHISRAPR
jgi:Mg2+ and Co2+ transporter CorA